MQQVVEYILSSIVMVVTPILFGVLTLDNGVRKNKKKVLITIFISCVLYSFTFSYLDGGVKTICTIAFHIFMYIEIFRESLPKSIFITFIYVILLMICDMLSLAFFVGMLGMSKEYCYEVFAGSLISNVVVCAFITLCTLIMRKKLNRLFNSKIEKNKSIVIMAIFTTLCVIVLFFDIITNYRTSNNVFSYVMLIVVFLTTLLYLIREKIMINNKMKEYNGLLEFMNTYESEIEKNKVQNHEIKNQFITIESMVKDEVKKETILEYVQGLIKEHIDIDSIQYSELKYLPLNGIKGLISYKIAEAEAKGINVSIMVEKGIEKSKISDLRSDEFKKLGILLGVYLDNAIEAAVTSKNKNLGIELHLKEDDVLIVISNSFNNTITIDKKTGKRISSKGEGRGHGLQLANQVVVKSNRFNAQSEIIGNLYIQRITVKK